MKTDGERSRAGKPASPSILHPPTHHPDEVKYHAISSVTRRHVAATREATRKMENLPDGVDDLRTMGDDKWFDSGDGDDDDNRRGEEVWSINESDRSRKGSKNKRVNGDPRNPSHIPVFIPLCEIKVVSGQHDFTGSRGIASGLFIGNLRKTTINYSI